MNARSEALVTFFTVAELIEWRLTMRMFEREQQYVIH